MSWINPSSKQVAQRIDQIFKNEKGESYYTCESPDPAKQRKFEAVVDEMHVYLQQKWVQHKNITTRVGRLDKVRGNANDVAKRLKHASASSMVNRATDAVLAQLDHRTTNNIPLYASVVPGTERTYTAALTAPRLDAGNANALTRSNSLSGSAISGREPPPSHVS